ncbi:MAG: molecular chaperone [Bdellovibrionaceae bacterium]|nr:molecular chaperone [Pseudobdellovibrionaceae bacterium]|tara:strand:+ start:4033 stop:5304 length:1272 start_codon:yes stop_codon:yes gene_type:complete
MAQSISYAIDFGTSNSLLLAVKDGQVLPAFDLDPLHKDSQIFRSLIYFPKQGAPSFGQKAIEDYTEQAGEGRFLRSFKKHLPSENFSGTRINNQFFKLEDLVALFLKELKSRADRHYGEDVKKVVMGRPAKFSMDPQLDQLAQDRLKTAAETAGFEQIEFFQEPLAAAFDYRNQMEGQKNVLIVDLGGGTSDFTLIRLRPENFDDKDVLSIGGLSVAGDAMDGDLMGEKIAPHLGSKVEYRFPMGSNVLKMPSSLKYQLKSPADIVLLSQKELMSFLKDVRKCTVNDEDTVKLDQLFALIRDNLGFAIYEEIDRAKRQVSESGEAKIAFKEDGISIQDQVHESEFKEFTKENVEAIFRSLDEVVRAGGLKHEEIDKICLTGGTSKLPAIKEGLRSRFGAEKLSDLNSFQSVIQGLAKRASEIF